MRTCEKCNVRVVGERESCPLCQNDLSSAKENANSKSEEVFPLVPTIYHQFSFIFKLLIFISVVAVLVSVSVNLILPDYGAWSLFVVGGVACLWISLALAIRKRKNIPKNMMYQVVIISVGCVLWDVFTGWRGWSVDYVIPILCIAVMISLAVLSIILNWKFENIIIYFCIEALFCIVPLIFYLTGILHVVIPSIICSLCSVVSIAAIIIFKGDSIWAELKRRLYI